MPTDCPTREKLGWCNDAQSSCEQMLTDFETERFFAKWLQDLYDAQLPDGAMPGIVPSSGWGYGWGNGPVSDGVLFEVPHRLYLHTGEDKYLIESLPYFDRYLAYLETRRDENGDISFGLDDWAPPDYNDMVRAPFVNAVLLV
jgi:alpha-L-rhamnosidase